ncbi:unnamed protein product [Caenorhabditis sp. 36 PRJEB53466]|nr:unnamed protein product [Caenorhabditis sp. 36 PRJEB53466]
MSETVSEKSPKEETPEKVKRRTPHVKPNVEVRRELFRGIVDGTGEQDEKRELVNKLSFEFFEEDLKKCTANKTKDGLELMLRHMPNKNKPQGVELSNWYMDAFVTWLEQKGNEDELQEEFLSERTLETALGTAIEEPLISHGISRIFGISQETIEQKVMEKINYFLENKNYKEGGILAAKNNFVDRFEFDQIALPLLLADKFPNVLGMMMKSTRLQKEFISFLDNLVGKTDAELTKFFEKYEYLNFPEITLRRFRGHTLKAFMTKFFNGVVKDCGFDLKQERDAPKLRLELSKSALKYYSKQRFDVREASDTWYHEHVEDTLRKSSDIITAYYLAFLWSSDEEAKRIDAICWVQHLNIPQDKIPDVMRNEWNVPERESLREQARMIVAERSFRNLGAPEEGEQLFASGLDKNWPIKIVETEEGFVEMCSKLGELIKESEEVYVGYDSEGKEANLVQPGNAKIALVQLFFLETAWIIDNVRLESLELDVQDKVWADFADKLFRSENVLLVGFDMQNDLRNLMTVSNLQKVIELSEIKNVVCLKELGEAICRVDLQLLGMPKSTFRLSVLSKHILGWDIDKAEQASNWQFRPLRKVQILYAAVDAIVVSEIFKRIVEKAKLWDASVEYPRLLKQANVHYLIFEKNRNKKLAQKMPCWPELFKMLSACHDPNKASIRPSEAKVIVDTMVLGFGKILEKLGVDVIVPNKPADFHRELAKMKDGSSEQRIIATVESKSYEAMKNEYSKFFLMKDVYSVQVLTHLIEFCKQYNIEIKYEDNHGFLSAYPKKEVKGREENEGRMGT